MRIKFIKPSILFYGLAAVSIALPLPDVMAESLADRLLRFAGISVTASQVRGATASTRGNLWLSKIDESDASQPKPITSDGDYHSPLFIPDSNKILAIKSDKLLIQLGAGGGEEKVRHRFSESTTLLGFDKQDAQSLLVLQDSMPGALSLTTGRITPLPFNNENNSEDRKMLDQLKRNVDRLRDYGHVKVLVKSEYIVDARGRVKINKIHIKDEKQDLAIPCPMNCTQPALTEDGQRLIFVGQ